jgi:hypothetical protein
MGQGQGLPVGGRGAQARSGSGPRSLLIGIGAATILLLTFMATAVLGAQDQALVALSAEGTTSVPPSMTPTIVPPTATERPTRRPTATPVGKELQTSTAEPKAPTVMPTATSEPTTAPQPTLTGVPSQTLTAIPVIVSKSQPTKAVACVVRRPAGWWQYKVPRKTTIKTIARRFGTSESGLQKVNCLSGSNVRAGAKLWVPPVKGATPNPRPEATKVPPTPTSPTPDPAGVAPDPTDLAVETAETTAEPTDGMPDPTDDPAPGPTDPPPDPTDPPPDPTDPPPQLTDPPADP